MSKFKGLLNKKVKSDEIGKLTLKGREFIAKELGINESDCHFAYMSLDLLNKTEQILLKWWREKYDR